ncbi:hypothetical protein [Micromonospora sp. NBC_01739]|uniref:hypothetical protein n=1 Tax=Micromonospora sp. NBC_01739 TaxID=2975985 RepID=UPI002E0FDAB7|nr:hypothetical protein OIE53_25780 [Micromonospora sp. NBC_01739]
MVYRYDSDEDAYGPYRDDDPEGQAPPATDAVPAGPPRSRFPAPSLPRPNQMVLPSTTASAAAPPPQDPPPRYEAATTVPYDPSPAAVPQPAPASAAPPPPRRGGGRTWQVLIGGAAALVLLALCGLAGAALLDGRQLIGQQAAPSTPPEDNTPVTDSPRAGDLDSRDTDQAPLTGREVFPNSTLTVGDGRRYEVLRAQSSASCAVAATGEVSNLLVRLGCSQVVRATLRSSDQQHLVTAGLFNLTDRSSAERARDRIRQVLDDREGRFRGMPAGDGTEVIATAPARVGWQVRGHYVAYAVVTRADGDTIRSGDTAVREILFDLLELHLNREVLEHRANGGIANQPTPAEDTGSQNGSDED